MSSTSPLAHEPTSDVPVGLGDARRIVVPTDAEDVALARSRRVALRMARATGAEIVLYDRSDERWTDTPHPTGPLTVDEVDDERRPHLVSQMREALDAGVPSTAWLASVPALTAMLDVIQDLDVDVVVVPDELGAPKLMDRITVGSSPAEMVERIARLQLDRVPTLVSVADDETASIVTANTPPTTADPQEESR